DDADAARLVAAPQLLQHLVAAAARQHEVEHHHVERLGPDGLERGRPRGRRGDPVAALGEMIRDERRDVALVVHYQNPLLAHRRSATGSRERCADDWRESIARVDSAGTMTVSAFLIFMVALLVPPRPARDQILLRVLATNDFHSAFDARVQSWSNGRPAGGAAALAGMMN